MKEKTKIEKYISVSFCLLICIVLSLFIYSKKITKTLAEQTTNTLKEISMQNQLLIITKLKQVENNVQQLSTILSTESLENQSHMEEVLSNVEIDENNYMELRYKNKVIQKNDKGIKVLNNDSDSSTIEEGISISKGESSNQFLIQKKIKDTEATLLYYYNVNNFLTNPLFNEEGCNYLIEQDGFKITTSCGDSANSFDNIFNWMQQNSKKNKDSLQTLKEDIKNKKEGMLTFNDGQKKYMYYIPIDGKDWYLLTIVLAKEISKTYFQFIPTTLYFLFFVMCLFLLLLIYIALDNYHYRKKLYHILYVDPVTKGYSYEKFKIEYEKMKAKKALIIMDIENFKLLNKLYGYENSNTILMQISNILEKNLKEHGFCARQNDDRYIICLSYKNHKEIVTTITKIYEEIKNIKDYDFVLNSVFGIYKCQDESIQTAQTKAVIAWNNAKANKNFYVFYEENDVIQMIENKKLLDRLLEAVENKKLEIYFQPKYEMHTKKIAGSEALLRWREEDGKMISPQNFIPIAEQSGFITTIDSYVMDTVCKIIATLKKEGYNLGYVSINVSRKKLEEEGFISEYENILKAHGLSKKDIELEITEGAVLSEDKVVNNSIKELISRGFNILIDDFGTGYSSVSMLKNIKVKGIKIDRSFVIDESEKGKEILKYVISLAHKLDLETIAEGVEENSQYEYLKSLKCTYAQGYHFSKPLPLEEYKKKLQKK